MAIRIINRPRLIVQWQFEPRDLWIGVFWRRTAIAWHLYVCVIPLLPLHVTIATVD
jgi:hypothetical protein